MALSLRYKFRLMAFNEETEDQAHSSQKSRGSQTEGIAGTNLDIGLVWLAMDLLAGKANATSSSSKMADRYIKTLPGE